MRRPPRPPPGPDDVYRGSLGRWLGATAARTTSGGGDGRSAARPSPTATAPDVRRRGALGGQGGQARVHLRRPAQPDRGLARGGVVATPRVVGIPACR